MNWPGPTYTDSGRISGTFSWFRVQEGSVAGVFGYGKNDLDVSKERLANVTTGVVPLPPRRL